MADNSAVRARIDEPIKHEAAAVLQAMGLTVSDAFRMMMIRIAREKALPFEPLAPNAETIAAMRDSRTGKLPRFKDVAALMKDLNAPDRAHDAVQAGFQAGDERQASDDAGS
jgi:DNA-damage-inducible protein J